MAGCEDFFSDRLEGKGEMLCYASFSFWGLGLECAQAEMQRRRGSFSERAHEPPISNILDRFTLARIGVLCAGVCANAYPDQSRAFVARHLEAHLISVFSECWVTISVTPMEIIVCPRFFPCGRVSGFLRCAAAVPQHQSLS